ncbi:MAG: TonB-dependent receptor [Candidatus Riflebacteria bacterium]|nr:TonB-dependent receptor [Candidatus Riflebacteria bacterium]
MTVEIKNSSKKSEDLLDTPGAVFVLTSEDIRRAGVENIPDALRLVPGLYVAQMNSNRWAINSRSPNSYSAGSFLVLVDGRSVYAPLFSGVYWDGLDFIMKDIDRIEVLRGPGAAVWGANAVSGVINIITKVSQDTKGGHLGLNYGTGDGHNLEYRFGGDMENGGAFRFFLKGTQKSHYRDFSNSGIDDAWGTQKIGFRSDWNKGSKHSFRFQGELYQSNGNEGSYEPNLLSPDYSQKTFYPISTFDGNLIFSWKYNPKPQNVWEASLSFDRFMRHDSIFGQALDVLEFEAQNKFKPSKNQDFLYGFQTRTVKDSLSDGALFKLDSLQKTTQLFGVFVQDEITLRPDKFSLTLGSRFDKFSLSKGENQPSARLLWKLDKKQSIWGAVSRAVQFPSRGLMEEKSFLGPVGSVPNPAPGLPDLPIFANFKSPLNVAPQILFSKEIGYRINPNPTLSIDLAAFRNQYENLYSHELLTTQVGVDPIPYLEVLSTLGNNAKQTTKGFEFSSNWQPAQNLKISSGYTWNWQTSQENFLYTGGFPDRKWFARFSHEPKKGWELDAILNWVNKTEYSVNNRIEIPSYSRVDFRISHHFSPSVEWSAGVQNAFQPYHKEYGIFISEILTDIPRNYYLKADYTF